MGQINISASIVAGNTTTNAIQMNNYDAVGMIVSASTLTATTLTFLVGNDGTNFYPLYDDSSTEVSISASKVARAYSLPIDAFFGWNFMKVREGTSASAVAQATYDVPITIVTRSFD